MGKKDKILIVNDSLDNLYEGYSATKGKYDIDVACDLEGSMEAINSNNYKKIITDMCFHNKGVSVNSESTNDSNFLGSALVCEYNGLESDILNLSVGIKNDSKYVQWFNGTRKKYQRIPEKIKNVYLNSLNKSNKKVDGDEIKYRGITDINLSDKLIDEVFPKISEKFIRSVDGKLIHVLADEMFNELEEAIKLGKMYENDEHLNSLYKEHLKKYGMEGIKNQIIQSNRVSPTLGYYIIKEAQKRKIPVKVITSTHHTSGAILATVATGLIKESELINKVKNIPKSNIPNKFIFDNVVFVYETKTKGLYRHLID